MRILLLSMMMLAVVGLATGQDLGNRAPQTPAATKGHAHIASQPGNNPRQGGDNIAQATVIGSIPFIESGTTAGYTDDYDEICPYTGSTAPDVVYSYTPAAEGAVDIDLCGSAYDTKVYVYDEAMNVVACNDDYYFDEPCGVYVSLIQHVELSAGATYYIVIDGYGGDYGDYELGIYGYCPCILECPAEAAHEGEPELMDGYVDEFNSGCGAPGDPLEYIQVVEDGAFCAVSGWYLSSDGSQFRDTDWFRIDLTFYGYMIWTCDAEHPTYMFELLYMPDCGQVAVGQTATAGPCLPATLTLSGEPEGEAYFWVGPTTFNPPGGFEGHEYDYVNFFEVYIVATETSTWSQLKAMYR